MVAFGVRFIPAGEPATFRTLYSGLIFRSNTCSKANVKHLFFFFVKQKK